MHIRASLRVRAKGKTLRVLVALIVGLAVVFSAPRPVRAESDREAGGKAEAAADAIKHKALRRLGEEVLRIREQDRLAQAQAVKAQIETHLQPVQAAFDTAGTRVAREIGAFDNAETVVTHLERTLRQADVNGALAALEKAINAALVDGAAETYATYRARFDAILYEAIEEPGLLGPLADQLVAELQERIRQRSYQLAVERGDIDVELSAMRFAPDKALMGAIAVYALHKIVARLYSKMALKVGAKTALKGTVATLLGPLGWVVVGAAVLWDISEARQQSIEAAQGELRRIYQGIADTLLGGSFVATALAEVTPALEQQLARDREAAGLELDQFFTGILIQAQSSGFQAFLHLHSPEEALKAIKKVSAVFGRTLVAEVSFGLKYALAADMEAGRAGAMLDRHGLAFVQLYERQPEATVRLAQNPRYPELFRHILQADRPEDEVVFFERLLGLVDSLDAPQTDALLLARRLHPQMPPERFAKASLGVLAVAAGEIAALSQTDPELAGRVVDWTLRGDIDGRLMERLTKRADMQRLLAVLIELGPDRFAAALKAVGEGALLRFVGDLSPSWEPHVLTASTAILLLRDDPAGYLRAYARPEGGGMRAVQARRQLREQYGTPLSPETEARLRWLLTRTSLEAPRLTKTAMEDLRAFGLPGAWPGFLARPLAHFVVQVGWTRALVIGLALLLLSAGLLCLLLWKWTGRRGPRRLRARAVPARRTEYLPR